MKNENRPSRACDTALSVAFGSGWDATEPNVLAALESYINELRSLPINLLTDVDWPAPEDSRQWSTAAPNSTTLASTMDASIFARDVQLALRAVICWLSFFLLVKPLLEDAILVHLLLMLRAQPQINLDLLRAAYSAPPAK